MTTRSTHVGFADESYWNDGRFRGLGLVTTPLKFKEDLEQEIRRLLTRSDLPEFKWNRVKDARRTLAAKQLCTLAIKEARTRRLRIDVLVWDTGDSRHKVRGRDDTANLERMYYHLFRNVLRARWPNDAVWSLYPDENSALNWLVIRECLWKAGQRVQRGQVQYSLLAGPKLRREFGIESVQPVRSEEYPLLQLADVVAGLAVFSHKRFPEFGKWCQVKSEQRPLFELDRGSPSSSKGDELRFQLLKEFGEKCKSAKLGVSLSEKQGLFTFKPSNPINFWLYSPQHPDDRAPTRS